MVQGRSLGNAGGIPVSFYTSSYPSFSRAKVFLEEIKCWSPNIPSRMGGSETDWLPLRMKITESLFLVTSVSLSTPGLILSSQRHSSPTRVASEGPRSQPVLLHTRKKRFFIHRAAIPDEGTHPTDGLKLQPRSWMPNEIGTLSNIWFLF